MKLVAYYHVYLSDDLGTWSHMVLETMKAMEDSNLLSSLDELRVTAVTKRDGRERLFHDLLVHTNWSTPSPLNMKIEFVESPYENDREMLANIESDKTVTENHTFQKMWNDARSGEEAYYLYLHTKGITSTDNLLRRGNAEKFKMYYYWRQYLTYGTVENWRKCVEALQTHDVAGVNFYENPAPHFSGSFWWATTDYLKRLANPSTKNWWYNLKNKTKDQWLKTCSDRFRDEMWLCNSYDFGTYFEPRVYNVHYLPQKHNPAAIVLPRRYYAES